jgi:hypothetical protein
MTSGEGAGTMRKHEKPTLEELEHLRKYHLDIKFIREYHEILITYVHDCREDKCPLPHTSVGFYTCPSKPCPPGSA